jgi:hypothetical protein
MLPAVLVLAAVVAARWTASTGRRRRWSAFLPAVVVAMVVTAVGVAASMAVFRWIIPLSVEYADPDDVLMIGAVMPTGAALIGAVIGYFLGLRGAGDPIGLPVRLRYVLGGTFAVAGVMGSGGRGESHSPAPTDPCVKVSLHTALVILVFRRAGPKVPISSVRTSGDTAR